MVCKKAEISLGDSWKELITPEVISSDLCANKAPDWWILSEIKTVCAHTCKDDAKMANRNCSALNHVLGGRWGDERKTQSADSLNGEVGYLTSLQTLLGYDLTSPKLCYCLTISCCLTGSCSPANKSVITGQPSNKQSGSQARTLVAWL